jgi:hypothetical protein
MLQLMTVYTIGFMQIGSCFGERREEHHQSTFGASVLRCEAEGIIKQSEFRSFVAGQSRCGLIKEEHTRRISRLRSHQPNIIGKVEKIDKERKKHLESKIEVCATRRAGG